jgi:hypothetical protein
MIPQPTSKRIFDSVFDALADTPARSRQHEGALRAIVGA